MKEKCIRCNKPTIYHHFHFHRLIDYISRSIRPVIGGWLIVAAVIGIAAALLVRRRPVSVAVLTAYVVLVLLSTVVSVRPMMSSAG